MQYSKQEYKEKYSELKKICVSCNVAIVRDNRTTYKKYSTQKYCSLVCKGIAHTKSFIGKGNPNWKGGNIVFACLNCNVNYETKRSKLKTSHFCSRECNSKFNSTGSKHWNWQGGLTNINIRERGLKVYKLWRKAVFERDNYTCIDCGDNKGGNLNADHIKPFSLFPELRFAIDNGRTLCVGCHKKTDTWGGKIINIKKELNYAVQ